MLRKTLYSLLIIINIIISPYHLAGRDLPLAEESDTVDVAGVDADSLAGVHRQMSVPHGHGQVEAGGPSA